MLIPPACPCENARYTPIKNCERASGRYFADDELPNFIIKLLSVAEKAEAAKAPAEPRFRSFDWYAVGKDHVIGIDFEGVSRTFDIGKYRRLKAAGLLKHGSRRILARSCPCADSTGQILTRRLPCPRQRRSEWQTFFVCCDAEDAHELGHKSKHGQNDAAREEIVSAARYSGALSQL